MNGSEGVEISSHQTLSLIWIVQHSPRGLCWCKRLPLLKLFFIPLLLHFLPCDCFHQKGPSGDQAHVDAFAEWQQRRRGR